MLEFGAILDQLAQLNIQAIELQGTGEPLMNPQLPAEVAKCTIPMGLVTNGVLFTRIKQDVMMSNLTYVKFSVLDSDAKRYAYVHGCSEKEWGMLIRNIDRAIDLRAKDGLDTALMATVYLDETNFWDAYNIVSFFKNLGLDYIVVQEATFSSMSPAGKADYASSKISQLKIADMKSAIRTLNDSDFQCNVRFPLNNSRFCVGIDATTWKKEYCQGIKFSTLIGSDGEVYPCWRMWGKKEFSYGSIYQQSFLDIWTGTTRKKVEDYILKTPPTGIGTDSECNHCNITKLNDILWSYANNSNKWKGFLLQ